MGGSAIANLFVKLSLQGADFSKGLKQAEGDLNSFGNKVAATGQKLAAVGRTMALGLTLPLVAIGAAAVNSASDQAEAMAAVQTVYGSAASQIHGFTESVAQDFGLSRTEALSAAAGFGVFANAGGLVGESAVSFSNDLVGAAADMASFYNAPMPEALAAIQSGLTGEIEPLRRFGILMSEAAIQEYAMANGIWDGTGAMTEQQKVLARQGFIMENLGAAQGDFARTQGGMANSMRIAKAEFKDASAVLGELLLPYVTQGIRFISDLVTKIQSLSPAQQKWIVGTLVLAAVLGPLLIILGSVATAVAALIPLFAALTGPIGVLILALVLLGIAYKTNFLGFADAVNATAGFIKAHFIGIAQNILVLAGPLGWLGIAIIQFRHKFVDAVQLAGQAFMTFWEQIQIVVALISTLFAMIDFSAIFEGITGAATDIGTSISDAIVASVQAVTDLGSRIVTTVYDGIAGASNLSASSFTGIGATVASAIYDAIRSAITPSWGSGIITAVYDSIAGSANLTAGAFAGVGTAIADAIWAAVKAAATSWNPADLIPGGIDFTPGFKSMPGGGGADKMPVGLDLSGLSHDIEAVLKAPDTSKVTSAFADMGTKIKSAMNQAVAHLGTVQQSMATIFSGIATNATTMGGNAGSGFRNMLASQLNSAVSQAGAAQASFAAIFAAIATVATVMGSNAGQGFANTLRSGLSQAVDAANWARGAITSALTLPSMYGAGYNVGSSLGAGIAAGISAWVGSIAATAANAVNQAEAAARSAADARSPSRLFAALGSDLAAGIVVGMESGSRAIGAAGAGLIAPPSLGGPGPTRAAATRTVNITINGASDPDAVWAKLDRELSLRGL